MTKKLLLDKKFNIIRKTKTSIYMSKNKKKIRISDHFLYDSIDIVHQIIYKKPTILVDIEYHVEQTIVKVLKNE